MMTIKNKIFICLFALLSMVAASPVSAADETAPADAWALMEKELSEDELVKFKRDFGENREDYEENHVKHREEQLQIQSGIKISEFLSSGINPYGQSNTTLSEITQDSRCYMGKDGTKYCMEVGKSDYSVSTENNGCGFVEIHLNNYSKCFFCPLIGVIFSVADKVTVASYSYLGRSFAILAVVVLLLWLAVKTLGFVSALSKQDAAKYLTECIQQIYKFLIAFFALLYYGDIFRYILLPLLNAGLDFGSIIVDGQNIEERFGEDVALGIANGDTEYLKKNENVPQSYKDNLNNVYFGLSTLSKLDLFVYNVNLNYARLQAIGRALMCLGFSFMLELTRIGLGVACFINGFIYFGTGLLLGIVFAFFLLDAVVQLGLVGALLPFMIACWPFKLTSPYTKNGFKMFLNSLFTFMMMGIISATSIALISQAMESNVESDTNVETVTTTVSDNGTKTTAISYDNSETSAVSTDGYEILKNAINKRDIDVLKERVNVLTIGFIMVLFACYVSFTLIGKFGEIVGKFAGGGIKPIAPEIGHIGASAAKGAATKISKPARDAIHQKTEELVEKGAKMGVDLTKSAIKAPIKGYRWLKNKIRGNNNNPSGNGSGAGAPRNAGAYTGMNQNPSGNGSGTSPRVNGQSGSNSGQSSGNGAYTRENGARPEDLPDDGD